MSTLTDALAVLESPTAASVISTIGGLIPGPIGAGVAVAAAVAPSLAQMIDSFLGGTIDQTTLQSQWDAMLADGKVADALVAAAEAQRAASV